MSTVKSTTSSKLSRVLKNEKTKISNCIGAVQRPVRSHAPSRVMLSHWKTPVKRPLPRTVPGLSRACPRFLGAISNRFGLNETRTTKSINVVTLAPKRKFTTPMDASTQSIAAATTTPICISRPLKSKLAKGAAVCPPISTITPSTAREPSKPRSMPRNPYVPRLGTRVSISDSFNFQLFASLERAVDVNPLEVGSQCELAKIYQTPAKKHDFLSTQNTFVRNTVSRVPTRRLRRTPTPPSTSHLQILNATLRTLTPSQLTSACAAIINIPYLLDGRRPLRPLTSKAKKHVLIVSNLA